jgi:hypothetical protein
MLSPQICYFDRAYHKDMGLNLPLIHLLGNRISLITEDGPAILDISAWQFRGNVPYAGRFHISAPAAEIVLLEDITQPEMVKDFPSVLERMTRGKLAVRGMYYPRTNELWDVRIHPGPVTGVVIDEECDLVEEARLHPAELGWDVTSSTVYIPDAFKPKKLVPVVAAHS